MYFKSRRLIDIRKTLRLHLTPETYDSALITPDKLLSSVDEQCLEDSTISPFEQLGPVN